VGVTAAARVAAVDGADAPDGCVHDLFEAWVDRNPAAIALVEGDESLTYEQLEGEANRLARFLRSQGIGKGALVGLYFERSARPIVAILACLKAGAGYVPIDPVYPVDRIRFVAEEAELALLLTEPALAARAIEAAPDRALVLEEWREEIDRQPSERLTRAETDLAPDDLCYVIYTSGTTGRPKGIMTEHRNAHAFVLAFNRVCSTTPADRIFQGFSLSFDGSVEEIWMAFSNGAALVVGDVSTPKFGNDLADFLAAARVTYFSTVPTMLSTMARDVPALTQLVVSGEVCPPELVDRWALPGRRMLNVYGPTEATVNTTSADCHAGAEVTIGRPIPGYRVYILDEAGRPVAAGAMGELHVGGPGLARGYLKQPELTAQRFVVSEQVEPGASMRLYRSGDLARWNGTGELEFHGRLDGQVKIRGYRVELAEIESVLREDEQVAAAAASTFDRNGVPTLAAYVVLQDPRRDLDNERLLERLRTKLPDYMVPTFLDILDELPLLTSGKVDRGRLPPPVSALVSAERTIVLPASPLEATIASTWARLFQMDEVSTDQDFFLDLGGHSLLAAKAATLVREATGTDLAVRDVYQHPTVRRLAAALERRSGGAREAVAAPAPEPTSRAAFESVPASTRRRTAALQAVSLYLLYGVATLPAFGMLLVEIAVIRGTLELGAGLAVGLLLMLGIWPALLTVGIVAKWLLIGRYQPGEHPLWGGYYFRWWLVGRLTALSGAGLLAGTPMMAVYYRLMGARVGGRCSIETAEVSAWDLVSIGDETTIGPDTQLLGVRVEGGMLRLGRVDIGSRCFLGTHVAIGLDVRMEDEARLDDQSMLPDGSLVPVGQQLAGSPPRAADVLLPEGPRVDLGGPLRLALYTVVQVLAADLLAIVLALPALVFLAVILAAVIYGSLALGAEALLVLVPTGVIVNCLWIALVKRLLLARAEPGVYPLYTRFYLRKWLSDSLMRGARATMLPVFTTLYLPAWLRLLGARIGARAEMSTIWSFAPELLDVADESFFADGCILGGRRTYRGRFELRVNHVGRRTFIGNSAILPTGASIGERCLLGVLSAPPRRTVPVASGTEWLGSPAFPLPNRQKAGNFDERVTYRPTRDLYMQRAVIDALRILIPGAMGAALLVPSSLILYAAWTAFSPLAAMAVAPLVAFVLGAVAVLLCAGLKWLVMGRFAPVIVPLWSRYVWWNEMVNGAYESVAAPAMAPLLGTPFVAWFLRLFGCRIGKHTYIESTLLSEWDLVEVGDYAALNRGAIIQTHLFEDRVMKSSHLRIGAECTVGNMSAILYDTVMERGASLGPLSLLMKGETLGAGSRWHGIPTVRVVEPEEQAPAVLWFDWSKEPSILLTGQGWLVGHLEGTFKDVADLLTANVVRLITRERVHEVETKDVIMVVPPSGGPVAPIYAPRLPLRVSIDLGVAMLQGTCYGPPGISAWEMWQRAPTGFYPVRDAVLDFPDGTSETAGTVLVSRHGAHEGLLIA